jgi:hypothetical protein
MASRCRVTAANLGGALDDDASQTRSAGLDLSATDFGVLYGAVDSDC